MLPGLRSGLTHRPPASSSAAVRSLKFPLASYGRLPLRLSHPNVPHQPIFLPSPISSSRPRAPVPSRLALLLPSASAPSVSAHSASLYLLL